MARYPCAGSPSAHASKPTHRFASNPKSSVLNLESLGPRFQRDKSLYPKSDIWWQNLTFQTGRGGRGGAAGAGPDRVHFGRRRRPCTPGISSHIKCLWRRFAKVNSHTNSSTFTDMKDKLTDPCGNGLLRNDLTACTSVDDGVLAPLVSLSLHLKYLSLHLNLVSLHLNLLSLHLNLFRWP